MCIPNEHRQYFKNSADACKITIQLGTPLVTHFRHCHSDFSSEGKVFKCISTAIAELQKHKEKINRLTTIIIHDELFQYRAQFGKTDRYHELNQKLRIWETLASSKAYRHNTQALVCPQNDRQALVCPQTDRQALVCPQTDRQALVCPQNDRQPVQKKPRILSVEEPHCSVLEGKLTTGAMSLPQQSTPQNKETPKQLEKFPKIQPGPPPVYHSYSWIYNDVPKPKLIKGRINSKTVNFNDYQLTIYGPKEDTIEIFIGKMKVIHIFGNCIQSDLEIFPIPEKNTLKIVHAHGRYFYIRQAARKKFNEAVGICEEHLKKHPSLSSEIQKTVIVIHQYIAEQHLKQGNKVI